VGKGPGRYNRYLAGAFDGSQLSKLYAKDLDHAGIIAKLDQLFADYVLNRKPKERFGTFVIRAGFVATQKGTGSS
jgi:sulfite reductase (NADPH) hemoprotein beta-component